ncbi:hypothetical protein BH11BAC2_BH11BAC2_02180 [soil metagenome]
MTNSLRNKCQHQLFSSSKFFLIAIFCLIHSIANAQVAVLKGTVTDAVSRVGIPGISVVVLPLQKAVNTDADGNFSIDLDSGAYTVEFRALGYQVVSKKISLNAGRQEVLNISMEPISKELGTTVISAGKFEQKLEEVSVTMAVLKTAYLENSNQTTAETAMEQVPGVTVIDGQANIRGGSGFSYGAGSRVLVLVDDLPALAGDANDVKWSFLPIENVEQIEVLKGASSALFGSSALNGVINMRTAYPKDKPETKVTFFSGWYGTPKREFTKWWKRNDQRTSGMSFSHRQQFGQFDLVLGGNYFNDDGYRDGESEIRKRGNINLRYRFKKVQGLSAGIAVNTQQSVGGNFLIWQDDSLGTLLPLGGVGDSTSTLSLYTTKRTTVDPYITYVGKKASHRLRTRYYLTNNVNNTNQEARAEVYFGEYLFQYHFSEWLTTTAGISSSKTTVNGDLYSKQNGDNTAIYAQVDGGYKRLKATVGVRNEQGHISGESLDAQQLFRAGANYHLLKFTYLRASYGQGFRFPSIAEKFIKTQVGNIVIYPNDSLKTETGWSAEIGVNQGFKIGNFRGLVDVSVFQTNYRDMMEFTFGGWGVPGVDPFFGLGFKSTNIGNANISGFEISVTGEQMIGKIKQQLMMGYTWIDPVQDDFNPAKDTLVNSSTENVLKYRYRQMFKFDAEWTYKKVAFGFSSRYYSFMENIDKAFEVTIPGVQHYRAANHNGDWIFDSRLAFLLNKSFTFSFIVKNVFNEEFMTRPADIQPPRSFIFQLLMKI